MESLKKVRKSRKINQTEIAEYLNIKQATYSGYETGKSNPSLDILIKMADFYKITLNELVGHEVPYLINKSDFNEVQLAIIEELKNLNIEQSYMLLAYIDGIKQGQEKRNQIIEKLKR